MVVHHRLDLGEQITEIRWLHINESNAIILRQRLWSDLFNFYVQELHHGDVFWSLDRPKEPIGAVVLFRPRMVRRASALAMASGSGSCWIKISRFFTASKASRNSCTIWWFRARCNSMRTACEMSLSTEICFTVGGRGGESRFR